MNNVFREAATGTAFNLSLTKRQVEFLLVAAEGHKAIHHSRTVGTFWELVRKGLIMVRVGGVIVEDSVQNMEHTGDRVSELTQAGRLVVDLLREAGYYVSYELGSYTDCTKTSNFATKVTLLQELPDA